jgi:hypothetical protein
VRRSIGIIADFEAGLIICDVRIFVRVHSIHLQALGGHCSSIQNLHVDTLKAPEGMGKSEEEDLLEIDKIRN